MGPNSSGVRERKQKTSKNEPENQIFGPVLTISLEYNKNCLISDALLCVVSLVKISNQFDHISGSYIQKSNQKQPKLVLPAGKKTFEIWKLENYKSDVNETYMTYKPP